MYGLELAFVIFATIGGVLFLGRFVLQLLGLQRDVAVDISSGDLDLANSDVGFKLLSYQSITAFLTMFGLAGFALYRSTENDVLVSLGGAVVGGGLTAWVVAVLSRVMRKQKPAISNKPSQAIGGQGTVYLTIPANDTGKVTVTLNGRLSVFDSVAQDKGEIKTGENVVVVDVVGQNVLMVKRI